MKRVLISLASQTVGQDFFEVIVVDNGPTSETAEVVNSFVDSIANLRYLQEPAPGLHNARHRGMCEASAEFLVFADDDIEAFPCWLEGVWQGFTRHNAALVGGRNLPRWEVEPPGWLKRLWSGDNEGERFLSYLSILDFGDHEKEIDPFYVWGCNFSIRKKVLLEAGGFHPDSMPDQLLHLRGDGESHVSRFIAARGYGSVYVPSASVFHFVPKSRMTVDYFRKRAFSQGVSDSYTRLRLNPSDNDKIVMDLRPLGRLMRSAIFRHILGSLLPADAFVRANIDQAYHEGFMWHLHRFLTDGDVRSWVLKENYLEPLNQ
ncbi:glycosyltransferase [Geobacter hydrogenophilus]|nr:glycosyltransferase [Geobacter hydrogenophilus]